MTTASLPAGLTIGPLTSDADARECAHLMATSDPWITLGRGYEDSLRIVSDATREVYVAKARASWRAS